MLYPNEMVIHNGNFHQLLNPDYKVDGERKSRGLIPRSYESHPLGCYSFAKAADAINLKVIDRAEWPERIADQIAQKGRLSDIRMGGNKGGKIPSLDQNGKGYCFPAGTRIRMANGSQKKIEDIQLLDQVLTAEGNLSTVRQLHTRPYTGDLVRIRSYGHTHLECTPNHSILTKRGYVRADQIKANDLICIPRFAPQTTEVIQTSEYVSSVKRRLARVNGQENWETRLPDESDSGCVTIPDFIRLTPGAGRIFGLWLAEGHIDSSTRCVIWSFDVKETDTLAADVVRLLAEEWGATAFTRPGPASPNVIQVVLRGVLWTQLFTSLCGKLAGTKRVHASLLGGPLDFLKTLFDGWMDGDGCNRGVRGKGYCTGATISHDLALNMYDIANAIGLTPSINREGDKPWIGKDGVTRQPAWKISVNPNPGNYRPNYRFCAEDTRVWRLVKSTERRQFSGNVFNIGVEGDNSYVAEGVSVHNCWAHSTTGAVMIARAVMGEEYVALSAYAVACIIKNFRDEGGWGAESAEFIATRGVPSAKFWPMQSMDRSHDNAQTWENAALHKLTAGWVDMNAAQYDRKLTFDQYATLFLTGDPGVCDFNWWGHSVCGLDVVNGNALFGVYRGDNGKLPDLQEFMRIWGVDTEAQGYGTRILNSWGDSWSEEGMGVLTGSHAIPDGGLGIRTVRASAA